MKVIENSNFVTFPSLTADLVSKHLTIKLLTILGYQHKHK